MSAKEALTIHDPVIRGNTLICNYSVGLEEFASSYTFPSPMIDESAPSRKLCQWMAVITSLGLFSVDYFEKLQTDFELSEQEVKFFEKLIYLGLGEFRYANKIPIHTKTKLLGDHPKYACSPKNDIQPQQLKPLLLNGGGKDGSVSALLLKETGIDFTWFNRGSSASQQNVVKSWSAPSLTVIRKLDQKRLNGKYSGHRPISASIAFLALLTAQIYGYSDVIASNELSASEESFELNGFKINHQYSKSAEFEQDLQSLLKLFGIKERYFSLLRPLHELQIALLSTKLNSQQLKAITSCNHGTAEGRWCLNCAKCAFVILIMTAASPVAAKTIWGGETINSQGIQKYLLQLLDPTIDKPLECVGTLEECQIAAHMILQNQDLYLNPDTRKLLEQFAKKPSRNFITHMGSTLIPKEYTDVLGLMKKQLSSYAVKRAAV